LLKDKSVDTAKSKETIFLRLFDMRNPFNENDSIVFVGKDLSGADLSGANLEGAGIWAVNLNHCRNHHYVSRH
jgi:uncharacterized protein YjbI with pentapeptide repeats